MFQLQEKQLSPNSGQTFRKMVKDVKFASSTPWVLRSFPVLWTWINMAVGKFGSRLNNTITCVTLTESLLFFQELGFCIFFFYV